MLFTFMHSEDDHVHLHVPYLLIHVGSMYSVLAGDTTKKALRL